MRFNFHQELRGFYAHTVYGCDVIVYISSTEYKLYPFAHCHVQLEHNNSNKKLQGASVLIFLPFTNMLMHFNTHTDTKSFALIVLPAVELCFCFSNQKKSSNFFSAIQLNPNFSPFFYGILLNEYNLSICLFYQWYLY